VQKAVSALYFLVNETGSDIITSGSATMVAEGARVVVGPTPGRNIVFVLPLRAHFPSEGFGLPDLWEGVDAYRDALIALFRQVRLGKGFRFFVDPLPTSLELSEEANTFVPVSAAFDSEWGEWLARKYRSLDRLADAWALGDRNLKDFHDAAALLPLWGGAKGIPVLFDRTNERPYAVNTGTSQYWADLNAFKAESVRNYMNDLATALKKTVADVPVVYRSRGYSALFTGLPAAGGFDGIGVEAYGSGADLVTHRAGYVYAQAAEAPKTMWMPVVATADAEIADKTTAGYASRAALHSNLDWLREIGARAFYVDGVRVVDPARKLYDLSTTEEQLTWLADYARVLAVTGVSGAEPPATVFYPVGLQDASLAGPKRLPGGAWWLPSERPYRPYDFGVSGRAYALSDRDGGLTYYLWNPSGPKTIRLKIPKAARAPGAPVASWSASAKGVLKGDTLTLTIGPDPIRLANYPVIPVPIDAFDENYKEVKRLAEALRKQSSMDAVRVEQSVEQMKGLYNQDNPWTSVTEIQNLLEDVRTLLRPYAWLEAERATGHNFDQVIDRLGASGGRVLVVEKRPSDGPIPTATYAVNVRTPGPYHVWTAASAGAPLTFRMDGRPLMDDATLAKTVGAPYADGTLIWTNLGIANLTKGSHTIEMRASGPAVVDVVLLTRDDFMPNGATPPPVNP
jgi:hypothetical protein